MFESLSLLVLIPIFIAAAFAVWFSCIALVNATDIIDTRFGLSQAFGGLIFLTLVTNLPEIAIVVSASLMNNIGIAIGNILGGIALQTVVLVILDGFDTRNKGSLTYKAASLQLVLEAILVIIVLVITIMGTQLPSSIMLMHVAPSDLFIVLAWGIGLWLIMKARTTLPWHEEGKAPDTHPKKTRGQKDREHWSSAFLVFVFITAALITFAAGVVLERSASAIAMHIGWSGVLFGSTILAFVTALPEISSGLAAIKLGDYTLAFSDIFGGNAFLPTLFLVATLLSGKSVLPYAQNTDIYLAGLGALLTAIYIYGLIFRPKRQFFHLGIDSILVLFFYVMGIIGLFFIAN